MKMKRFVVGLIAFLLLLNSLSSFALAQTAYNLGPGVNAPNTWTALQTFSSGIVSLSVIGGTGTTSTLTLQSTSGVGASGADIIFKVGNNGATEAMRWLNNGVVEMRDGANAKSMRIYNTYTDSSNYERATLSWIFNKFYVGTDISGTGLSRTLQLDGGPAVIISLNNTGKFTVINASAYSPDNAFDLGNMGTDRFRSGFFGTSLVLDGSNGQHLIYGRVTELVTVGSGLTTKATTIQIPADAIVYAVPVRVVTQPGGTSTMTVTATTSGTAFQKGANISTTAGTTDPGTKNTPVNYNAVAAQTVTFTFNVATTDALGQIRVDIYYATSTPPTS